MASRFLYVLNVFVVVSLKILFSLRSQCTGFKNVCTYKTYHTVLLLYTSPAQTCIFLSDFTLCVTIYLYSFSMECNLKRERGDPCTIVDSNYYSELICMMWMEYCNFCWFDLGVLGCISLRFGSNKLEMFNTEERQREATLSRLTSSYRFIQWYLTAYSILFILHD